MRIPANVLEFSGGEDHVGVYKMFRDYWNHYRFMNGETNVEYQRTNDKNEIISFSEKEDQMNAALRREIVRMAGVPNAVEIPAEKLVTNPMYAWATFAVVSAMIDMVLPESIIQTNGIYTDVRSVGYGDSQSFDIESNELFVVSKAGRAQRTAEMHKQYKGQLTLVPEMREISVQVSLYKVLSGMESLAVFVMKAIRSLETQMSLDVYSAFATAMDALPSTATTGLQVAGYTQSGLTSMCQRVSAWNGGAKAVILGTPLALANVLPNDANYRYWLDSEYVKLGYIRTAFGYDVMALPQVADLTTPWGVALSDSRLWVVSPSAQKLVKLVLGGNTLANTTGTFQNANLTQSATIWKAWVAGVATNAVAGVITL